MMKHYEVFFTALLCIWLSAPCDRASAESASQNSAGSASQNALQELETELAAAREDLHISEATEERIASELKRLKNSGDAAPEVLEEYEIYLNRVQSMVLENRKIVRKMEALYAKYAPRKGASGPSSTTVLEKVPNPKVQTEKEYDELGALDREFDESLASFDEMLLKELDKIRTESADKMRDLVKEEEAAAELLKEEGVAEGPSSLEEMSEGGKEAESEKSSMSSEKREKDTRATTVGDRQEGAKGEREGQVSPQKRPSRPAGQEDDIVARQIREAAEKETDPVLKEKLWKEYEDYKKGSRP